MTDALPPRGAAPVKAQAKVHRARRRISPIWFVPVLAALIAGFLAWHTMQKEGPLITIRFANASGIEVGKTPIKFKDVKLGVVSDIALADDLKGVVISAQMTREADRLLTNHARFWVVSPHASLTQISGLDTLLSGAYIAIDPGAAGGDTKHKFVGLSQAPIVQSDVSGTTYIVNAERLGSLNAGSPVFFRDFPVGHVLGYDASDLDKGVALQVFVRSPYDRYVRSGSNFWNASGIGIKFGADGVELQIESLEAVLAGGIAFDTPDNAASTPVAAADTKFQLYKNQADADAAHYHRRISFISYFEGSWVSGLGPGSPVEIYGIQVGRVTSISLGYQRKKGRFRVPVRFDIEPGRIGLPEDEITDAQLEHNVKLMVDRGLRTQLRANNILTGQQVLALDFFPNAPQQDTYREGDAIVMPSTPAQIEGFARSATDIMNKISALPFAEIGENLNKLLKNTDALVSSPDLQQSIASLKGTLVDVQSFMKAMEDDLTPVLKKLPELSDDLQAILKQGTKLATSIDSAYGSNSRFQRDLDRTMLQVNDAVRSIRVVADLLSAHPEALILGRSGKGSN